MPLNIFKLAALVSGRGSNLQAIIDSIERKELNVRLSIVISSTKDAPALKRAEKHGIETVFIDPATYPNKKAYDKALIDELEEIPIDLICLAGYMRILGKEFIQTFSGKIINIHPSLLPLYGGKGMYGKYVHQKVFEAKDKESGITIHFVNKTYDDGLIIFQAKCPLPRNAKIKTIQKTVKNIVF